MKHWPTILLVEDDPNDAVFFQEALRDNAIPAHLQRVAGGHAAVEYLKGEGRFTNRKAYPLPGFVVLDLHMPGMEGMAVLRWIRQQDWLQGLPVVVCSGSDHGKSLTEAMQSGADAYIIKGAETGDLVRLLKQADLNWRTRNRSSHPASGIHLHAA